jgi:23S rRNA-/tRNA-specific pseudouridylate synthase
MHEGRKGGELECTGDQRLANFLRKALPDAGSGVVADSEQVELLIHLGAVHVRKCKEKKRGRRMLAFSRRLEDGQIRKGSLVRVYTRPVRFTVGDVDWRSRALFEDGDYVIVDKPAGIPYRQRAQTFASALSRLSLPL